MLSVDELVNEAIEANKNNETMDIEVSNILSCWHGSLRKSVSNIWDIHDMSRLMGKPTICIGENKDADQLCGNREAEQRLYFRYWDSTIPPLLNSKISSF